MSCQHGSHEQDCDICDEVNFAYKSGYESGGKTSIDLTMNHLRRAEKAESELAELRRKLRDAYEIYAGMEGIPIPQTACESYLLRIIDQMQKAMTAMLAAAPDKE